jgi:hypothetical protein
MKAPKMELDETNMEVEPEQYYEVEEELISVKNKMWGLDRIRSSDGHTFRVEHDVTKKCINILFDEEMEVPINHEIDRRVTKAVKRARQRSLMEEELIEFKMSQCMQHTMFQSTETIIIKEKRVARRACQKSSMRTASATPTPEAPAKTGDHSDNYNRGKDEDSNEDEDVGESSKHIKPSPIKYAAQSTAEAATKEESTDRDSQNSEENPNPKKADRAERQPAQHPQDNQPPAIHVSAAASMVSKYKPKDTEQNRNKERQEGQMETTDTTEDDAEEEDTEEKFCAAEVMFGLVELG